MADLKQLIRLCFSIQSLEFGLHSSERKHVDQLIKEAKEQEVQRHEIEQLCAEYLLGEGIHISMIQDRMDQVREVLDDFYKS